MFELLVYMCFGARLGQGALDEIEAVERHVLASFTSFPVFAFFPALTKRLFRRRWAAHVAVRRRLDEIFAPLIHAAAARRRAGEEDRPPCYAESLLALRVADEGDRGLSDAEMVSLCSEFLNAGTDTMVDHGRAREPPGHPSQGVRGDDQQRPFARAQRRRRPPGGIPVPEGCRARGPAAAPTGALPHTSRRAGRRGGRRLHGAQRCGGELHGGGDRPRRVPAGEVPGRRRGVRRRHHGEQGDQDDALRRRPEYVPWPGTRWGRTTPSTSWRGW
ncbi:hypothetical protein SEVIR_5G096301v4 [Setaria viridis]|uniref:Cytochrome P450 n=1 Tax=Setaria viridis TaxID=4556 RepID=A0A4U6UBS2_SETVI|nr:hypothetical protein SEVIR_5G096301v2 [Setaria viridis]